MALVSRRRRFERYELTRSPLAQNPTQREIATLVGELRDDLRRLATPRYKNLFVVRRKIRTGSPGDCKVRDLAYPTGRLRAVHERLKFHLDKIVQPSYLMSPRKGRTQRDNAEHHLDKVQYLTIDIKKFYPSTTRHMVRDALKNEFGMAHDVAGLIAHIATVDDIVSFGSPLTPVLTTLVHRRMFDDIAQLCVEEDFSYSVWVDDITISGKFIKGDFIESLRQIISSSGLRSHKIALRTGNRPVFITGVGVVGSSLIVPGRLEKQGRELWNAFGEAVDPDAVDAAATRLLSHLGGVRHVVGASSKRGRRISDQMNSVRQKREKAIRCLRTKIEGTGRTLHRMTDEELEANPDLAAQIPF